MVTKKIIQKFFPDFRITQFGSKQLFLVINENENKKYLVSYKTVVGRFNFVENIWEFTTTKYSITTTKHINFFINYTTKNYRHSDDI